MRLTRKSKDLLDLLFTMGVEVMEASTPYRSMLAHAGGWSSEQALRRFLASMGEKGWIIWDDSRLSGAWVSKVTDAGKDALLDAIDPETAWAREWDGRWRMLAFDLPERARGERHQLGLWLKRRRFGSLQGSLRITPLSGDLWLPQLDALKLDPTAVVFFEGKPMGQLSDRSIAERAWNFDEIDRRYREYLGFLAASSPPGGGMGEELGQRFATWFAREGTLWRNVTEMDPFLPETLLPKGYRGKEALASRRRVYGRWTSIFSTEGSAAAPA